MCQLSLRWYRAAGHNKKQVPVDEGAKQCFVKGWAPLWLVIMIPYASRTRSHRCHAQLSPSQLLLSAYREAAEQDWCVATTCLYRRLGSALLDSGDWHLNLGFGHTWE